MIWVEALKLRNFGVIGDWRDILHRSRRLESLNR